jgi:hypothetical protein
MSLCPRVSSAVFFRVGDPSVVRGFKAIACFLLPKHASDTLEYHRHYCSHTGPKENGEGSASPCSADDITQVVINELVHTDNLTQQVVEKTNTRTREPLDSVPRKNA